MFVYRPSEPIDFLRWHGPAQRLARSPAPPPNSLGAAGRARPGRCRQRGWVPNDRPDEPTTDDPLAEVWPVGGGVGEKPLVQWILVGSGSPTPCCTGGVRRS
jgi:hypothetical protein